MVAFTSLRKENPVSNQRSGRYYRLAVRLIMAEKEHLVTRDGDDKEPFDNETLLKIEEQFDNLFVEQQMAHIDISQLNTHKRSTFGDLSRWRKGPTEVSHHSKGEVQIKIAQISGDLDGESDHGSDAEGGSLEESDRAFINYFVHLGTTGDEGEVDYNFLEHALETADVNFKDKYGQSAMHEVAREWSIDLANYLFLKGAKIDMEDNWGRTPLFVAASSNHTKMVNWLVENGADISHQTIEGEQQYVIHFAAKNDCVEAFQTLIRLGADPMVSDARKRTPFFLAAERGHQRMCKYMLEIDLPVASYSLSGLAVIDHVVEKLPNFLSTRALDQFIVRKGNYANYYLSCLGKKRWKLLNFRCCAPGTEPQTILKLIIHQRNYALIKHPVILKLLEVKREFSSRYVFQNVFWNFMFTFLWTISASIQLPRDSNYLHSNHVLKSYTIFVVCVLAQLLTFGFIVKIAFEYKASLFEASLLKHSKCLELEMDRAFCHPTWPLEEMSLDKAMQQQNETYSFFKEGWNIIEAVCLIMATGQTVLTVTWYVMPGNETVFNARLFFSAVFVVVVWLRLNRALSFLQWLGPFIAMLGECLIATLRFAFLFFEFYIPFSVAFWILFGNKRKGMSSNEYETFNDLLYQLFLLTFVGDYSLTPLKMADQLFAQIVVSSYIVLASVVSFNLYIALLSEAFVRVNDTASATAYLKEACEYNTFGNILPELEKRFETHLNKNCAPLRGDIPLNDDGQLSSSAALLLLKKNLAQHSYQLSNLEEDTAAINKDCMTASDTLLLFRDNHHGNRFTISNRVASVLSFQTLPMNIAQKKARKLMREISENAVRKISNVVKRD